MYTNDLTGLLITLEKTQASGVISTEGTGPGVPWQAQLTLTEGRVTTCHVQSSVNGRRLLTDGEAIRWLASLGYRTWERAAITPQRTSPLVIGDSQTILLQSSMVPRRLAQAEPVGMHAWSRKQRQVFALVDGNRSTERIALMLCLPLNVVEDIVHDLQSKNVIAVDKSTDELREEKGFA
jgi:hypothetical protein